MNHLAHALLACDRQAATAIHSAPDSAAAGLLIGGLLGDFVRGRLENLSYPNPVIRGIELHRRIDRVSDAHELVRSLKLQFPPGWRRYAGIILDMHFDHLLVRQWSRWCDIELETFTRELFALWLASGQLTPRAQGFIDWARTAQLFSAYGERQVIETSLEGIGRRLTRPNPLAHSGTVMWDLEPAVSEAFPVVFGDLQDLVSYQRRLRSTTTGS